MEADNKRLNERLEAANQYAARANSWLTDYKAKLAEEKVRYDQLKDVLVNVQVDNKKNAATPGPRYSSAGRGRV